MNLKIYYLIVGCGAGIVSIASFILVIFNQSMVIGGWAFPLLLGYAVILLTGSVSFIGIRLAFEKEAWL